MPMTGVMPEPAVRNSALAGRGLRQHELAGGLVELDDRARASPRCTRWLLTLPSGIALTVTLMQPSARVRSEVSE